MNREEQFYKEYESVSFIQNILYLFIFDCGMPHPFAADRVWMVFKLLCLTLMLLMANIANTK